MLDDYIIFLVILFIVAGMVRDDFVFTIVYLFAGVYILGRVWSARGLKAIRLHRNFVSRAFYGEEIQVKVDVENASLLPVVWLRLREALPVDLLPSGLFDQVVSVGPKGRACIEYTLQARKRGYYPVGPLFVSSGDLLGISGEQKREGLPDYLTIYPKIIPFTRLELPSHSPLGTLRHNLPIFEDPTRVVSKRDYQVGDSLRRVDWKSSAALGRLQVKQFEPSIALETSILLSLNNAEYDLHTRFDATELAIVVAASVASWITGQKQTVGLLTNGVDPQAQEPRIRPIPPRKGRGHLMRILDTLARIQPAETISTEELLRQEKVHLSWGTTLIIVAGQAGEALFDQLFQARRAGLNIVLILVGAIPNTSDIRRRADTFGFPVYFFSHERDLDVWRR